MYANVHLRKSKKQFLQQNTLKRRNLKREKPHLAQAFDKKGLKSYTATKTYSVCCVFYTRVYIESSPWSDFIWLIGRFDIV